MLNFVRSWSLRLFAASLVFATLPVSADDSEGVVRLGRAESSGVVRISDGVQSDVVVRGQSSNITQSSYAQSSYSQSCPHGRQPFAGGCPLCPQTSPCNWLTYNMHLCCLRQQGAAQVLKDSCREDLREKAAYLRCKFGYLCPNGYAPIGCYKMVYPVDPYYFDQRDGQVYAAPGYGGPVSVPLAPVVENAYNYGWGVPSSRLTRVAHPLTPGVAAR